ncbi:chitotriosidase-1-like isoform X1 [Amphiura filiformis]|uniref:chitotriosidase-1-like isoform X1 n=1 Tax=Amphiura filiformis TaxID=82378 RepID=UPI003B20CC1D
MLRMIIILMIASLTFFSGGNAQTGNRFVCYHTNWSQYRTGATSSDLRGKFTPENIDPSLCTHIMYSFAKLDGWPRVLAPYEWNDDAYDNNYDKVIGLKNQNPDLKVFLALGGWTHGVQKFREMAATATSRQQFINHAITFLRIRNFDGLDLDWEYPIAEDKERFTLLCEELQAAFQVDAQTSGNTRLLLSAAVPAGSNIDVGYDVPRVSAAVDFLNLMAYDLYTHWDLKTGHHAALYSVSGDDATRVVKYAVDRWLEEGCPPNKLTLGIGTYGRSFTLTGSQTSIFAPASGAIQATYTKHVGYWAYFEICEKLASGYTRVFDLDRGVPYAYGDGQWVGYDDIQSINIKVNFLKDRNLGGAMIWAMDLDDFSGTFCDQGTWPLLNAIKTALNTTPTTVGHSTAAGSSGGSQDDIVTTTRSTTTTTSLPTIGDTGGAGDGIGGTEDNGDTGGAGDGGIDQDFCDGQPDGLYDDPNDCISYYQCYSGGYTAHYSCSGGSVFNHNSKNCDWPLNYDCPETSGGTGQTDDGVGETGDNGKTTTTRSTTTTIIPSTTGDTGGTGDGTGGTEDNEDNGGAGDGGIDPNFCYGRQDGLYDDPNDCISYYQCYSGGYTAHYSCSGGSVFNHNIKNCDWPLNYDCPETSGGTGQTDDGVGGTGDNGKTTTIRSTTTTISPSTTGDTGGAGDGTGGTEDNEDNGGAGDGGIDPNFCYGRQDGLYDDPNDCISYYQCYTSGENNI